MAIAILPCLLPGCRGRAKDEIYLETMSAEIRDLEDQLYEYDYEYRRLEQENESLQRELNYRSQNKRSQPAPPSILDRNPSSGTGASDRSPQGGSSTSGNQPNSGSPSIDSSLPPGNPNTLPTPPGPTGSGGSRQGGFGDFGDTGDFDLDDIEPPRIEMGEQVPAPVTSLDAPPPDLAMASEDNIELNLSRIEVPALMASHPNLVPAEPMQQVSDRRIVEITFHPTLSRAADFDGQPGDDGLYLVLQPKNISGQMVDEAAELSIVVLDPSQPKGQDRIARWDYSQEDVQATMQPIGSQQGIHIKLPWNGPRPKVDRVIVFARYTANDRRVIGYREIQLWDEDELKTVWTPRDPTQPSQGDNTRVADRQPQANPSRSAPSFASSEWNAAPSNAPPHTNLPPRANAVGNSPYQGNVVRPASGSTPVQPAPAPVRDASGFLN